MSLATDGPGLEEQADPSRYTEGPERYIRFAEDVLDLQLARTQKQILRALAEHRRVLVMSGNGVGKSYCVAIAKLAFLYTNIDSIVLGTSGSYSQFVDAAWRPLKQLHRDATRRVGLPGETYDGGQPRLEIEPEWFAKVVSPRDPGDLEGRHAASMLVVIEEADKAYITPEHFDSAGSSITSGEDRMLAVCNPPRDEANVVAQKLDSDRWHVIQFSSFESHNVRVDAGELDAPKIPGLVDLETIREDWEAWNDEPWPGVDTARTAHDRRDDLDERWYRRRAGIIPPASAAVHRPFSVADVEAAWEREPQTVTAVPQGSGVDVARSNDRTVLASVHGDAVRIHYSEQGTDHPTQEARLRSGHRRFEGLGEWPDHPGAIDAVGEGSGLGDRLEQAYPEMVRFKAGARASEETEYKDCWTEGLAALGEWLREGGSIDDRRLREELLVAARVVEYDERFMASHGRDGAEVLEASSKEDVQELLGRSPDLLDAAYMAVWAASGKASPVTVTRRRGSRPSKTSIR